MLYTIKNLATQKVDVGAPWEFIPNVPASILADKSAYKKWWCDIGADHCLFSAYVGGTEGIKVTKENPPVKLMGVVADYDCNIDPSHVAMLKSKQPSDYVPSWSSRTIGGGARLVWLFEKPVYLPNQTFTAEFSRQIKKRLKLTRQLAGFDEGAFGQWGQYYDVGMNWESLGGAPIPSVVLQHWAIEAGNSCRWNAPGMPELQMEVVRDLIEERFPGRWLNEVRVGTGGVRFWDPAADNPRGAVIRATGMQCFTGPVPFKSWEAIFGRSAVEAHHAQTTGAAVEGTFYDGAFYWRQGPNGEWLDWAKEDLAVAFKVDYGITTKGENGEPSEMDRLFNHIRNHKRVAAAIPLVHSPSGMVVRDNTKLLNISTLKHMAPAPGDSFEWGKDFPWVAQFLDGFFAEKEQQYHFMAWLQRFYRGAVTKSPTQGQAVIISGGPGIGKTLLSTRVVSQIVGGHADASDFLMGDSKFTSHILAMPLMTVDDTAPATDSIRQVRYSSMLKKVVANPTHTYEKKYHAASQVNWLGRVMVTCNMDPQSIMLLPNLDISIVDKVNIYRCADESRMVFPESDEVEKILKAELPFLCGWLLKWEKPSIPAGTARFGIASFQDAQLHTRAIQSGPSSVFLEMIRLFLQEYKLLHPEEAYWEGSTSSLFSSISLNEGLRVLVSRMSTNQMAIYLGLLAARGYPFLNRHTRTGNIWRLPLSFMDPDVKGESK